MLAHIFAAFLIGVCSPAESLRRNVPASGIPHTLFGGFSNEAPLTAEECKRAQHLMKSLRARGEEMIIMRSELKRHLNKIGKETHVKAALEQLQGDCQGADVESGPPAPRHHVESCMGHAFDIVGGDDPSSQRWLAAEVRRWEKDAFAQMSERPEAKAGLALLKNHVKLGSNSSAVKLQFWASTTTASREEGPRVQAIAQVVKDGSRFGVPLIVSRRALFGREEGLGGGGKALTGALVEMFGAEADEAGQDLRLGGTPGDGFVSKLYTANSMRSISAQKDPFGVLTFGTLEFVVPQGCGSFFARSICGASTSVDRFKFGIRLVQHSNESHMLHPLHTCADMFPKSFLWDQATR